MNAATLDYLGIHRQYWQPDRRLTEVRTFISRRVFAKQIMHRASGPYAIDSGGFTELQKYGRWTITADRYVQFLRRCWDEVGPFDFAAPMDWMCEPAVISGGLFARQHFKGTKLSVRTHQRLTVRNFLQLRDLAPELPIIPVIQGWDRDDYLRCADMYAARGVDLGTESLVGLGSVCRRQDTDEAAEIVDALRDWGVPRLHGFGFKIEGLRKCWGVLRSADSLSASLDGRYAGACRHTWRERGNLRPPRRPGTPTSEANCLAYLLAWRTRHIRPPARPYGRQLSLFGVAA